MSEQPQITPATRDELHRALDQLLKDLGAEAGAIILGKLDEQGRFLSMATAHAPLKLTPHLQASLKSLSIKLPGLMQAQAAAIAQSN